MLDSCSPRLLSLASVIALVIAASSPARAASGGHATPSPQATLDAAQGAQRFIVKYRAGTTAAGSSSSGVQAVRSALLQSAAASRSRALPTVSLLRNTAGGAGIFVTSHRLSAAQSAQMLAQLRRDPQVEYAQIDGLRHALATPAPALSDEQWDMRDAVGGIHAPTAWQTTNGEGTVVAVLDTGILPHPALQANVIPGYDMISYYGQDDGEGGQTPDVAGDGDGRDADPTDPGDWTSNDMFCGRQGDSSWHGTHVAGTVAAAGAAPQPLAGVAWGAKVQPVRVLGHCGGFDSDIADGIIWASGGHVEGVPDNPNPAEVINMSLGGQGNCSETPALQQAIDEARARGTTVVVAAGNAAIDVGQFTPASCKGVIAVAATGQNERAASYSNYGEGITLAAPGGEKTLLDPVSGGLIWSAGDSGTTTARGDGILVGMVGTSMAAPHVAGVVALMQSAAVENTGKALTPDQVESMLKASARPFTRTPARAIGVGLLDAGRAVVLASGGTLPEGAQLRSGTPLSGQNGAAGSTSLYSVEVPAGARSLQFRSMGGRGDVMAYAAPGTAPDPTDAPYRSERPGSTQILTIANPQAGTWYLRLQAGTAYSNVSVLALVR